MTQSPQILGSYAPKLCRTFLHARKEVPEPTLVSYSFEVDSGAAFAFGRVLLAGVVAHRYTPWWPRWSGGMSLRRTPNWKRGDEERPRFRLVAHKDMHAI